jgi:hypothetical protein
LAAIENVSSVDEGMRRIETARAPLVQQAAGFIASIERLAVGTPQDAGMAGHSESGFNGNRRWVERLTSGRRV